MYNDNVSPPSEHRSSPELSNRNDINLEGRVVNVPVILSQNRPSEIDDKGDIINHNNIEQQPSIQNNVSTHRNDNNMEEENNKEEDNQKLYEIRDINQQQDNVFLPNNSQLNLTHMESKTNQVPNNIVHDHIDNGNDNINN